MSTTPRPNNAANRQLTIRNATKAFTLIELLVVMAIIGVISGAFINTFVQESRSAAVRQATLQLQSDLEILRSSTIRYNGNSSITLSAGGLGYVLSVATGGTPQTITRTFPSGIVAARVTGADVTYTAPLSTVTATDLEYSLTLGARSYYIKVIGVTGKAVFSATQ